ncbi:MAG: hypothetical protein ACKVJK_00675 [Methylophagaceae bacterium]|jgi:hypothetical protein|tara:strand:+ start:1273 stop:1800 length:528 start_codon:yes stop_codon:yes gene_type:complete
MIYIIHETIAGNDPRWQPGMELIGDFWNYSVSTAPDGTFVDWLHGKVVGEFVAKSYKFVTARDGEIPVAKMTNVYEQIVQDTGDTHTAEGPKFYYDLTEQDTNNGIQFMKTVMELHIQNHLDANNGYVNALRQMISGMETLDQGQRIMYDYFDCNFASTNMTPRKPTFKVEWDIA